ncbi:hypothetical protein C1H46_000880 [Malus baccata]|uniref:Uncharacterized protein n=1 Tax=Malus baccata TaxID=106549 RepID=A0A540NRB6_MALBA|nr:hypothetical protein C1H46_000880 [Malus baccata]
MVSMPKRLSTFTDDDMMCIIWKKTQKFSTQNVKNLQSRTVITQCNHNNRQQINDFVPTTNQDSRSGFVPSQTTKKNKYPEKFRAHYKTRLKKWLRAFTNYKEKPEMASCLQMNIFAYNL